jgi:hypothetical protein
MEPNWPKLIFFALGYALIVAAIYFSVNGLISTEKDEKAESQMWQVLSLFSSAGSLVCFLIFAVITFKPV